MVAMMLPALAPHLWRFPMRVAGLPALVALGYFGIWTLVGLLAYPLGALLAAVQMQQPALARAVPLASGALVLIAGAAQFIPWKARQLACCRTLPGRGGAMPADAVAAWRHGLRLGLHCSACCANLTAILLVIGVMDLRAMAFVTAAISAERLAPNGERVARLTGLIVIATGLALSVQAIAASPA